METFLEFLSLGMFTFMLALMLACVFLGPEAT